MSIINELGNFWYGLLENGFSHFTKTLEEPQRKPSCNVYRSWGPSLWEGLGWDNDFIQEEKGHEKILT